MFYATIATFLLLIFSGENVMSQEASSAPSPVIPIAIEQSYLEGRGLTRVDPSEFDGEGITRDDDYISESYKHDFYIGKIMVAVFEAGPGRVTLMAPFMTNLFKFWKGVSYSPRMAGTLSSSSRETP